jgi:hypothetical protein
MFILQTDRLQNYKKITDNYSDYPLNFVFLCDFAA